MANSIPGFMTHRELSVLAELFSPFNHDEAIGVEVGSLFGRSSYQISQSINRGKLYSIDLWRGWEVKHEFSEEEVQRNCYPKVGSRIDLNSFLVHTADCKNIVPIRGESPTVVQDWTKKIDFFFLDANHKNPNDWENIEFWLPKIKSGGLLAGHDYYLKKPNEYPDVIANVRKLEKILKQKVSNPEHTSIWYFKV